MLHIFINSCGFIFLACGIFFIVSSVVGLIRFYDFYAKVHAAGVADSCGIPMSLIGLTIINYQSISIFKILILIILIYILGPTATHTLLKTWYNCNQPKSLKINADSKHDANY
ncbi:na+/H+ antiporter subunit [Orientia chuto str. Dubai]|uniref:Na+/H+ antiporter subunit n=1 Tax=Orientia chuto str. Dubai TaxID=1359168 RepID=A0A0F3MMX4_9RICK|nr:monovalent cation/H(+) antiporter subunit G [Candidatus Orientia mediorientalis]KJV57108.1 na+/H+ antiporter subunit [Orientia chuto str. Dubai]